MKRQGTNKKTLPIYLAAFIELKHAIDENPKCRTSEIAKKFNIGFHPITMLKHTGVIQQIGHQKKWVGGEPNLKMVIQITEAIHNYHAELKSRKKQGELFPNKKRVKRAEPVAATQLDLNEWKSRYTQQKAQKTDIPIVNEPAQKQIFDGSMVSEFINHEETPKVKHGKLTSSKPKTRTFEVKIFGLKLFTINY